MADQNPGSKSRRTFLAGSAAVLAGSGGTNAQEGISHEPASSAVASTERREEFGADLPEMLQSRSSSATAKQLAGFDYRQYNASVIRRNTALNQPHTVPLSAPDDRAQAFSKALRRTETPEGQPLGREWGLPTVEAFRAYRSALDQAYGNALVRPLVAPGDPVGPTDHDRLDALEQFIGDNANVPAKKFKFTNPLGGLAFETEGLDPAAVRIARPPSFDSHVTASEMVELYWAAILRDVSFLAFASDTAALASKEENDQVRNAVDDLNSLAYGEQTSPHPDQNSALNRLFRVDLRSAGQPGKFGFPGVEVGPWISQFLLRGTMEPGIAGMQSTSPSLGVVNFGTLRLSQRQRTVVGGKESDYLYEATGDREGTTWHAVQNGDRQAIGKDKFDIFSNGATPIGNDDRKLETQLRENLRFIRNPRDGTNYVHFDKIYQEYLVAACILLAGLPRPGDTLIAQLQSAGLLGETTARLSEDEGSDAVSGLVAEFGNLRDELLNFGNPYRVREDAPSAQVGFATFGVTHIVTLLSEVSTRAHKAGWYHKWGELRLRPEEFAARVHANKKFGATHPISRDLWKSNVFAKFQEKFGDTYLLPMAFPEGSPTHPAYPSGHATVAGASVTMLKALFNESYQLTGPMPGTPGTPVYVPDPATDGRSLTPLSKLAPSSKKELFVGGELNKLASNIATFREMAGVHWRSDGVQGILLGEQVALKLLIDQSARAPGQGNLILPFYRERKGGELGAPFFRLTMFNGQAIDIVDGTVFRVDGAFAKSGSYNKQAQWVRSRSILSFDDLVNTQAVPVI